MASRSDADELARLRADILSLVLQEAGEAVARDPDRFVRSEFLAAARQAAIETVEARIALAPPPDASDVAEEVLRLIRGDLQALAQGRPGEARAPVVPASSFPPRLEQNKPFWIAAVIALVLLVAFAAFTAGAAFEQAGQRARAAVEPPETIRSEAPPPAPAADAAVAPPAEGVAKQ